VSRSVARGERCCSKIVLFRDVVRQGGARRTSSPALLIPRCRVRDLAAHQVSGYFLCRIGLIAPELLGPRAGRRCDRAGSTRTRPDKGADAFELRVFLGRDAHGRVQHRSRLFHIPGVARTRVARLITTQETAPAIVPNDTSRPWAHTTLMTPSPVGRRGASLQTNLREHLSC